MWNEKTKQLVADEKLIVIGVIQEQHAERCRLYRQWKEYKFPIVQDAFTGLGVAVVPVPILIDEYGIVISKRPRTKSIAKLVNQRSSPPGEVAPMLVPKQVSVAWLTKEFESNPELETLCALGDANLHLGSRESSREAIRCYQQALKMEGASTLGDDSSLQGALHFRLGVAYRMLFDITESASQDPNDFSSACRHWAIALKENPNQYIWRRRIQQYGPLQIKPYPFYDWVAQAKKDIASRGEIPSPLTVPLTGSEVAQPRHTFAVTSTTEPNPDPLGKITRDDDSLIGIHWTVVPPVIKPGKTVRVHLRFDPKQANWNNEVDELVVWINESDAGHASRTRLTHPNMKQSSSNDIKRIEFEFETKANVSDKASVSGYVLYYVCRSDGSQCLYRRQDFSIPILIAR